MYGCGLNWAFEVGAVGRLNKLNIREMRPEPRLLDALAQVRLQNAWPGVQGWVSQCYIPQRAIRSFDFNYVDYVPYTKL